MKQSRGFTLIELLVVMVIITMIVGFAALQLGDGGRTNKVKWQVHHFVDTLSLASDEAQFSGINRGVALWREGIDKPWQYSWFQQVEGDWVLQEELEDNIDTTFQNGELAAAFNADLVIEEEAYVLPEDIVTNEPIAAPQLYFFSGGEVTPFELNLWMDEDLSQNFLIKADLLGRVEILEDEDAIDS